MALIFLGVLIVLLFQVLSFTKLNCSDFIANDERPKFTQMWSTGLSGLVAMLESDDKLQPKPKHFPHGLIFFIEGEL